VPEGPGTTLTLAALFDRSVARRRDALAVKDHGGAWSYDALNARAAALGTVIRERGVARGDAVVIYADRTRHAVAAVLAVVKAGATFVPVGLETPPARVDFIIRDVHPKLLLTDEMGRHKLARMTLPVETVNAETVNTDTMPSSPASSPGASRGQAVEIGPDDLAYIIYTSGTTGQPKGVMVEHGSIALRFHDWDRVFGLSDSAPRCLQLAKFGFDVFIADLVKALGSGGLLVLCPGEILLDPARLHRTIVDEAIDYIDTVPAVLRVLIEYLEASSQDLRRVRIINCGADAWTKNEYQRSRRVTKVARLFNGYGVTECTVESTLFEDDGPTLDGMTRLPIGRALGSDEIVIVDKALAPVAPGVAGEICIGGPCVARGYLNRPELNARAFFVRPGRSGTSVRFYRTGDRGRVDAHGVFEFLGRMDAQIKINGQRVEPEEIERVLERFPAVERAAVCLDSTRQRLTAFIKTVSGASIELSDAALHVGRHLPSYMVPSRIVIVDTFPLTPNGKVDRARLANAIPDSLHQSPQHQRPAHDLHESRSVTELCERLWRRNIDLLAVVHEFVRPSATFGLLVSGAVPAGKGTPHSIVELVILLEDGQAMKRRKQEAAGTTIEYRTPPTGVDTRIALCLDGLDLRLDFIVVGPPSASPRATESRLPRPAAGWAVHGHEVVERWARAR
jgi:amino acid adenylation domain-containing protein